MTGLGTSMMPSLDRNGDNQSIRSGYSLGSAGQGAVIKHPDMHGPGLNASIVETVSAWFSNGQVTKSVVIGEVALAHNALGAPAKTETICLDNFSVLEKVAPNPLFIHEVAGKSGEYTVDSAQLARTAVAFKYQVHLDEAQLSAHAPVILAPVWKVEATQSSVILSYSLNSAFASRSITLHNVILMINVENARATSCMSKPAGIFSREKNMIYWKLGEVKLDESSGVQKLLARFATEGEAEPGAVQARWEMAGEGVGGSGLGVSVGGGARAGEADPFADGEANTGTHGEVQVQRKIVSGKYLAH
jgi:hypothetical protein